MKELKETHQKGTISIENIPDELRIPGYMPHVLSGMEGDLGIQIAGDGRVWICINGIAFLRFKPEGMGFGQVLSQPSPEEIKAGHEASASTAAEFRREHKEGKPW